MPGFAVQSTCQGSMDPNPNDVMRGWDIVNRRKMRDEEARPGRVSTLDTPLHSRCDPLRVRGDPAGAIDMIGVSAGHGIESQRHGSTNDLPGPEEAWRRDLREGDLSRLSE